MVLDLGGIVKGFVVDEVLKIYKKYNIENGFINLGLSFIYVVGKNKDNNKWFVGIKYFRSEDVKNYFGIIKLSNEVLFILGDYERYFIKDNKRYYYIINFKIGYLVDNGVMSDIMVIDNDDEDKNMLVDLLIIIVFILGYEKGLNFIKILFNVFCEIIILDYKIYILDDFKDRIIDLNKEFEFVN